MNDKNDNSSSNHPIIQSTNSRRRFSLFPKPLSRFVEDVVKPVYKKHGFAEHRILTEWNVIVGQELASYSVPQKLTFPKGKKENGTLHILVASARALELQHMQPIIQDKISTFFGYPAVSRITFAQTSSDIFRKNRKAKPMAAPVADASVQAVVAQCEDEVLRAALLSLGAALTAVEK